MRRRVQAAAPRRWFHATSLEAAEKILADGHLKPPVGLAEHYKGDKAFAPVDGLVYLTHDIELGLTYARIRSYKGRGKYGPGALIEVEPIGRCQADEDEVGAAVDFVLHDEPGKLRKGDMAGHELESAVGHAVLEYVPAALSAKWRKTPERGIGGWSAKQKAKVGKAALGALPREIIETITAQTRSIACEGARVLRAWRIAPGEWDAPHDLVEHERALLPVSETSYEQARARAHERLVAERLPLLSLPTRSQNPISDEWKRYYSRDVIALVHSAEKLLGVSVVGAAYQAGGGGSKGAVYPLSDGRVLKVTSDKREILLVETAVRDGRFDGFTRVYAGPVQMKRRGYVAYVREDVDPSNPLFDRPALERCVDMLSTLSDAEYREGYRQMHAESPGLSDFLRRLDEEQGISVGDTRRNIGTRQGTGELVLFDGQAYPMEGRKPNPAEPWLFRKRFAYALTRRPASTSTVPKGFVELGPATAELPFGTVIFERPLPRAAIESFELEPLDADDPIVLKRARRIYRDAVYERFSETSGFEQPDAEGGRATLSYSTRAGVEYQVTFWLADWTPTGHLDVDDFDEAVGALWSSMSKAERRQRAEGAVWRARR